MHEERPTQELLFLVAEEVSEELRSVVKKMIERLASKGAWVVAPPSFVDIVNDARRHEDDAVDATVGGRLPIFSALHSPQPRDLDLRHLQEVEAVVAEVRALSEAEKISFEFELDGKFVGAVDQGSIDKSLSEGLLGAWRRHSGE